MPPGTTHQPKQPLQPFVPVRSGERTELYSHRELCALTSSDPRNELDELSEPNRYEKDVTEPGSGNQLAAPRCWAGGLLLTFLAGAVAGGILVALTAPKTGAELRGDLKGFAHLEKWMADGSAGEGRGAGAG